MKILRVFNNNVVLAKDGAREVIVTGRGLGFQAKPGQRVDDAKIVRVFVPADGRDPDHIAELLSEIPPEIIRLVTDAMTATGLAEQAESQPTLVMALADHITGAVQRAQRHVNIAYPLQADVQSLYASEYAQASRLVNELNRHLNGVLPGSETVALALHLVNAADTYWVGGAALLVKTDNTEITTMDSLTTDMTVATQIATNYADDLQAMVEEGTLGEAVILDGFDTCVLQLINGDVDAVMAGFDIVSAYMSANPDQLKVISDEENYEEMGFAVQKGNAELLEKINAGLANVKENGVYDELVEKWEMS